MLRGIVYVSQAQVPFSSKALEDLGAQAAVRNAESRVTGYLYFERGRFVQYIEGETNTVTALMSRIATDERHQVLKEVRDDELRGRRFPNWHMRQLQRRDLVQIDPEHVLTDFLLFVTKVPDMDGTWQRQVWLMVNTIAKFRVRLHPGSVPVT